MKRRQKAALKPTTTGIVFLPLFLLAVASAALVPACSRKTQTPPPPRPAAVATSASLPAPAAAHSAPNVNPGLEEMKAQHGAAAAGPEVTEKIEVARAEGANGKTVLEVYAERTALNGKPVAVRGKVVKITPGVLGKNWIHLRDGTGSRAAKDDDLTVTTTDGTAATGDVILVRGVVGIDKDFGSGYTYSVMVENAKLSK